MNDRLGILSWSFPVGRLFLTQIRVSPLFLLLGVILGVRLGWQLGLVFTAILFVFVLAHELGHVLAARATGGLADEILIWPLGGLAFAQPGPTVGSALQTIAAGPAVNLLFAVLFFPGWYLPEMSWSLLNPVQLPISEIQSAHWGRDLLLLSFSANWVLCLLSVLPIFPLDGGQFLATLLQQRMSGELATRVMANVGTLAAILLMSIGLMGDLSWLVGISAIMLVLNVLMTSRLQSGESFDDSFMGYDFSQGYTSLEKGMGRKEREPRLSWLQTWKAKRRQQQQVREATRRQNLERQLDELLAKVHAHGMSVLTEAEKRQLRRASEELRHRTRPPE